jgi:hypothetical protein
VAAPVANIEKTVDPGVCSATVVYPTVTGTDICGATATLVSGLGASGLFPLGTSTEKWTVTDKGGNVVPVEFTVTIKTTNAQPTINQVSAISVPEDSPETVVQLTGIGYGNDCVAQGVTASVAWTNPTLLTNVVLTYVVGSATGNLTHTFGANKYGTATVTVTVKDNSGAANDTKVMEYTVTVTPVNDPPYLVTGKAITDKTVNSAKTITVPIPSALGELFDDVDGDVLTLTATLEGGAALPAWITVSGGLVTVRPLLQHMGTYNIVVKATDPGGLSATNAFKLTVLGYPTSIEPIGDGVFEVKMYPNPTRGKVNLDIEGNFRNVDLTVFNVVGEQILRKQYMAKEKITFDLSGHVTGMYFVRLKTEDEEVVKKLILEK